jgi:hypothetical protein
MTVNMVTLPEPQSGKKRPKLTTPLKRRFRHTAIYRTIKALAILSCLYGSEMVLLAVVIGKCEMPSTNISQENDHPKIIVKRQFVACNFR